MIDKLSALKRLAHLVKRFEDQFSSYKNADYNETQTRRDFIDPFFKALGWDIETPNEFSTIHWRNDWSNFQLNPTLLYHPFKNMEDHTLIRKTGKLSRPINKKKWFLF